MIDKWFPVLHHLNVPADCPRRVPWVMVAAYGPQAHKNHQQSLEQLAKRGGLDPVELWLLVHNLPLNGDVQPTMERAARWVKFIATKWA